MAVEYQTCAATRRLCSTPRTLGHKLSCILNKHRLCLFANLHMTVLSTGSVYSKHYINRANEYKELLNLQKQS